MAKTIQQILGASNMIGVAQSVRRGLPQYLPESFTRTGRRVVGNTAKYNKVEGGRDLARLVQYGAPASLVGRKGITQVPVTLAHTFESITHDPLVLQNLMRTDSDEVQQMAVDEIDRQTAEFTVRSENFRKGLIYSVLANGKIYFDGAGNLLFSSSGAVTTVDYGVPANNLNQANGLISASWATAGTKIIQDVNNLKKAAVQATGYELKHAFYGSKIAGYLLANTEAKELINRTPTLAQQFYNSGEIPNGFCGLQWHPVYGAFGTDSSGTVQSFFGDDYIGLFPEPSTEWWEIVEGSYIVPKSIDVAPNVQSAVGNLQTAFGMFDYAVVNHNPAGLTHYHGDTVLPLLKVPAAVYILDVTQ
jgi:hypothetical protein